MFNSPLSEQKADQIITILKLKPSCKVIDVGCGEGGFISRIHRKYSADCLGIDIDSSCIKLADQNAQQYASGDKLQFLLADVRDLQFECSRFDLAICIGSSHAFDEGEMAYAKTLEQMKVWVKPNGIILVGESYWKKPPEPEYLNFIGDPVGIYNSHEKNIQQAGYAGLIPMYATASNQDEWDHFEWCFRMEAEHKALAEPENEMAQKKLIKIREWNQYYQKFGRATMGFGFYLFLNPE